MMDRLRTWVLARPIISAIAIMATILLVLTVSAIWTPASIALVIAPLVAGLVQSLVRWSSKTPAPPPKRRPLTDIGDT